MIEGSPLGTFETCRRIRRLSCLIEPDFCDMARTLRMGENTFRRPCNFKELRVVKRAHISTCAYVLDA
jgi:hypothetical protein